MTRVLTPVFFACLLLVGAALAGPTQGAEAPPELQAAQAQR